MTESDRIPADLSRRSILRRSAAVAAGGAAVAALSPATSAFASSAGAADSDTAKLGALQVFTNNIGYEASSLKRFVIGAGARPATSSSALAYQIYDTASGKAVFSGKAAFSGPVEQWADENSPAVPAYYWSGDFSKLTKAGQYVIVIPDAAGAPGISGVSIPFLIETDLYEQHALSHVIHYFKGSRSSGQFDKADAHLPIGAADGTDFVDVSGGWYDAAGDFGIHFSQVFQGPAAPFLITTSVPLTAWALFASYEALNGRKDTNFTQLCNWTLDEAMFGADFLVRMKAPDGSFYFSIRQNETNRLQQPEAPAQRWLAAKQTDTGWDPTQVSFRMGGGTAIAALAAASKYKVSGAFTNAQYLAAAEDAFAYLQANNVELNGGLPDNILDDCEALIAATELTKATKKAEYRTVAKARAKSLAARLASGDGHKNYWNADGAGRPFFHPSNAGLPVVSLLNYLKVASSAERTTLLDAVRKSLAFELATTKEVANPFGYARQLVQLSDGTRFTTFFYPQDVSPSTQAGGWFQGENARIASLAAAARLAATFFPDDAFAVQLQSYADDQLNWICGLNPYASCMLNGSGSNNPAYYDALGTWQFLPQAGGINNGICGKTTEGLGIMYEPGYRADGFEKDWAEDWRRMEQWLPHSTWFLYAAALGGAA
ncbi:glycoside hydrolase family 9 protein [Actinospica robiniae]|uniref:glycoside hydrolase family 9 protein n=1 Tax=Actinospica robiniae TaxID=304901 RepID=UPI0004286B0A|nr:glycoside hydrolase family 9 protein [Actinospica robiniae]